MLHVMANALGLLGPPAALPHRRTAISMCAADGAPAGLRLFGAVEDGDAELWLGCYVRYSRELLGRPVYQHTNLPSRWLVWNGNGRWLGQLTANLPWGFDVRSEVMRSYFDEEKAGAARGYSTVSLPEDVSTPDLGTVGWQIIDGAGCTEQPLCCERLTTAELAGEIASARTKLARDQDGGAPPLEACHCTSCVRQGADGSMRMLRQLGASCTPAPSRGACGAGPNVYVRGRSEPTPEEAGPGGFMGMLGQLFSGDDAPKTFKVSDAREAAGVIAASGGAVPSDALVAAYDQLLCSYETPTTRPSEAEALAAAEGALTTPGLGVGGWGLVVRVGLWLS